jgi:hypothetical protein
MNFLYSRVFKAKFMLYLFTVSVCISCKKFLEINPAPDLVTTSDVFLSDNTALSAVASLYPSLGLSQRVTSGGLSIYAGLSADEIATTASSSVADPFLLNSLLSDNSTVNSNFYTFSYKYIYQCNAILEGLLKSSTLTPALKSQLIGEVRILRALLYFYLANLFGDVPLIISTNYEVNAKLPRAPLAEVYALVISDLKDAQNLLTLNYPSTGKARPNRYTASAFLARVYLYVNDWPNAEAQATSVISSGTYSLSVNLNAVFTINSSETIWEFVNDNGNTTEGSQFIPTSATVKPRYQIIPSLLNSFEAGDTRKTNWLNSNMIGGLAYFYPYKYKIRTASPINEANKIFRLAEQYLIRAEARAQQNNISGSQSDLNFIRNRAVLPNTTASTKNDLLIAVENERRVELFSEWGHRWLDLKRTIRTDAVLAPLKGSNWQTTDALYPIPYIEIQRNPFLTQNQGY